MTNLMGVCTLQYHFYDTTKLYTGANISCIGSDLATKNCLDCPNFKQIVSEVKTADGKRHPVIGILRVDVNYNGSTKEIDFYIIPSLNKRVILGINWRIFSLDTGLSHRFS